MGIQENTAAPTERRSLADALFSSTQQRVLALLFGHPDRSFFATEIIERLGAGSGAVQRELRKLAESGLLTVTRIGNQKHYQANSGAPIYPELRSLVVKTVGLADPLRRALKPAASNIDLALIYGSVASGMATAQSDIDLLIVSPDLTLEEVYRLLAPAERALGRTVNPTLYTPEEFQQRLTDGSPFLTRTLARDTVILQGELPDAA